MRRADAPFFPLTPPSIEGRLEVGDGHTLYYSVTGPADGAPLVSCHGGPGGSSLAGASRFVDCGRVRLIQFDQRGCGRSSPVGELRANSLQHTIADMEALRAHLGLERWIVSGGSWGSTVALAYAEAHPERCLGVFLVSTWLARPCDTQWWFHGVRTLFPELWEAFAGHVPEDERGDLRAAYCRRILGPDPTAAREAAIQLYLYEEGFMHFDAPLTPPDPQRGAAYGRIFAHYAAHDFFLADDQLLRDAHRVAELPVALITGRYDCCTPPDNAYALKRALPGATLEITPGAGHYPTEPVFARAVAGASRRFVDAVLGEGRRP